MQASHTIVVINNDEFYIIQNNPAGFVEAIRNGMHKAGPLDLHVTQRRDEPNIISFPCVGQIMQAEDGQTDWVVLHKGRADSQLRNPEHILRSLGRKLGYNVSRRTLP